MYASLVRLVPVSETLVRLLDAWGGPLVDLLVRVALFRIFFYAGLIKLGDWNGTLQLFQTEYDVPLLPYEMAALIAAFDELVASSLLLVGLGARLAAIPLLFQAAEIQFVLAADKPAYDSYEHYLWMLMLLAVIMRGPGRFSFDHAIRRRLLGPDSV